MKQLVIVYMRIVYVSWLKTLLECIRWRISRTRQTQITLNLEKEMPDLKRSTYVSTNLTKNGYVSTDWTKRKLCSTVFDANQLCFDLIDWKRLCFDRFDRTKTFLTVFDSSQLCSTDSTNKKCSSVRHKPAMFRRARQGNLYLY